jgi:hypothetical protein
VSTGVTCEVLLDGARLQDGSPGDDLADPVGLSGLSVIWGRATTIDQPDPSTCSLKILDRPGGGSFIGLVATGTRVTVNAAGVVYPDPTTSTFLDPGFETSAPAVPTAATAVASTRRAHTGARSLQLLPTDPARRWSVILPPAQLEPATGGDPAAWDAIPTTSSGQTWRVGASIFAPPGALVQLRPVLFSAPTLGAARVIEAPVGVTGNGAWQSPSRSFVPDVNGAWVGVQVTAYPTGPRWGDLPPALTWADLDPAWTWQDYAATYLDDVQVLAPSAGTTRAVRVFDGRVTDVAVAWDDSVNGPVVEVTAVDFTADLDNRDIGDEPWAVEPMAARFNRILGLAGLPITSVIDATVGGLLMSWQDIDEQPAAGLLRDLAASVDATMWPAVHPTTGAYLRVEDASTREPLHTLDEGDDGIVRIVTAGGRVLSGCDVLRDPVSWAQSVSDVSTRAVVSWQEQTLDDEGHPAPTERTLSVIDVDAEAQLGTRRISLSTLLQSPVDAVAIAERLLGRTSSSDWRARSLTVDDVLLDGDEPSKALLLDLLDGTRRIGLPLRVEDLPYWAPVEALTVYVEGGSLEFVAGRWVVAATLSRAAGQGTSITWGQLDPTWTWADLDPAITWGDLMGVGNATPETLHGLAKETTTWA